MICPVCGNNLDDDMLACDLCGTKLAGNEAKEESGSARRRRAAERDIFEMDMNAQGDTAPAEPSMSDEFSTISSPVSQEKPARKPASERFKPIRNKNSETSYATSGGEKKPFTMNKNNIIILSLVGAVVLLFVIVLVLVFSLSGGGSDPAPTPTVPPATETPTATPDDGIREIDDSVIRSIITNNSDYTDFGIYVRNLDNGYEYGYGENQTFLASAMCQVVILDTLSRAVDEKNIDIEEDYLHFNYFSNGKEAPDSKNEGGTNISIKKCMEDVAVYGDNNKSNQLVDYIAWIYQEDNGFDVINRMLRNKGYYDTSINRKIYVKSSMIDHSASPNVTTPHEIGRMFESLIHSGNLGSSSYMKRIFKSVSNEGESIGFKKYAPAYYDVCNVNALNSQSTNNVGIISDGDTELVVAILSSTMESKTEIEDNEIREKIQDQLLNYILDTQFDN